MSEWANYCGRNRDGSRAKRFVNKSQRYPPLSEVSTKPLKARFPNWASTAIVCARHESTELMSGVTEVLAYGTAVKVNRGYAP